jgi:hypothetical protein
MKLESYNKIMSYIDLVEIELDKIASAVGHPSFEEFFAGEVLHVAVNAAAAYYAADAAADVVY